MASSRLGLALAARLSRRASPLSGPRTVGPSFPSRGLSTKEGATAKVPGYRPRGAGSAAGGPSAAAGPGVAPGPTTSAWASFAPTRAAAARGCLLGLPLAALAAQAATPTRALALTRPKGRGRASLGPAAPRVLGREARLRAYGSSWLVRALSGALGAPLAVVALTRRLGAAAAWELSLLARSLRLAMIFLPLALLSPAAALSAEGSPARTKWMRLLSSSLERAGPAFIKWAQWASTRPDLVAPSVCEELSRLQSGAASHSFSETRRIVEASLGAPLEELFETFSEEPVASGSVAQVHEATLTEAGARRALERGLEGGPAPGASRARSANPHTAPSTANPPPLSMDAHERPVAFRPIPPRAARRAARDDHVRFRPGAQVAVKVRHPGVEGLMERDVALAWRTANALMRLPGPFRQAGETLGESMRQFGAPLREQLDLRVEAANLDRFGANFSGWTGVRFPRAAGPAMVSRDVLVETYEAGEPISGYLRRPGSPAAVRLARLGLDCYLKMLLRDRFVHADLHPGNILVSKGNAFAADAGCRRADADPGPPGTASASASAPASGASPASAPAAPPPATSPHGASPSPSAWLAVPALLRALERRASSALSVLLDRALAGTEHARTPDLVLLDVGMAASIGPADGRRLVDFFAALAKLEGRAVADSIVAFADPKPSAEDVEGFRTALSELFGRHTADSMREQTQEVVSELMESIRQHRVRIGGVVSTVIVTSCVLEGWSSALNPDVRVLDAVRGLLPSEAPSRIAKRLDDTFSIRGMTISSA